MFLWIAIIRGFSFGWLLCFQFLQAKELERPISILTNELTEFGNLTEKRQRLITDSLQLVNTHGWLKYKFGSSEPQEGGFDCSGAMYYLLRKHGMQPPRTSAEQFVWIKTAKSGKAEMQNITSMEVMLENLKPGDLLFWSGTYVPTDGRKIEITHVAMYLGKEKKDGLPVMVSSTSGRSYRGKRCDGYGVYEFKIPQASSRSKLVGYGTPPGLDCLH